MKRPVKRELRCWSHRWAISLRAPGLLIRALPPSNDNAFDRLDRYSALLAWHEAAS
jgi:hypothetical protein